MEVCMLWKLDLIIAFVCNTAHIVGMVTGTKRAI